VVVLLLACMCLAVAGATDANPFAAAEAMSLQEAAFVADSTFNSVDQQEDASDLDASDEEIMQQGNLLETGAVARDVPSVASAKKTPGVHCSGRAGCDSCLSLHSCLWNARSSKCSALTHVGRLSRMKQWAYVATCDTHATPTEQRIDRRNRAAHIHESWIKLPPLDHRKEVQGGPHMPRSVAFVESHAAIDSAAATESASSSDSEPQMQMKMFMDESPSQAVEAAEGQVTTDDTGAV